MKIGFFVMTPTPKATVHLRLAEIMIKSARAVMPDVPIVQLTDGSTARVMGTDECRRIPGDMPMAIRRVSHHAALEGDWLLIDPDVMFRRDVREVFNESFDVAITDRIGTVIDQESDYSTLMPHNIGVVFSRSPQFWQEVKARLLQMPEKLQEWMGDQIVVCEMASRCKHIPGKVYNFPPDSVDTDISGAAIVHYKGNRKDMMMFDQHRIIGGVELTPIKTYAALSNGEREANMTIAMAQGFPVLDMQPKNEGRLSIACYGPSLKQTWRDMKHPILSVSGAHDFLIGKGVIPDYHMDCDPRDYKANFVANPHPDVQYLMGSCMDKKTWENLKGMNVKLWHAFNGDETDNWMREHGRGQITIAGGSTAGLRAIMLGGVLGYDKFDIYGMDCSFEGDQPWAGPHYSKSHKHGMKVRCGTRWFTTSPGMVGAAREFEKLIRNVPAELKLHGDGMLQHMLKDTGYEQLCA